MVSRSCSCGGLADLVSGPAVTGTGIIGLFNISSRPLTELVPLGSFPGVISSMKYIVRAHTSGRVSQPASPGQGAAGSSDLMVVSLAPGGHEIMTAYPLVAFDSETKGKVYAANLGLVGKMTGAAAIVRTDLSLEHDGKVQLKTSLKALGVLGVYISRLPELTIEDDFIATIQNQVIPVEAVSVSKDDAHVLEIDVEKAWRDMTLHPGWSNEVEVKVFFSIDHEG